MDKVVILARVSTDKQEYQRQVNELTDYCTRVGWSVEAVFSNKVSESTFFRILRNRFYIGQVFVPEYGDSPEQYVKGKHQALTDAKLFHLVQDRLDGNRNKAEPEVKKTPDEQPMDKEMEEKMKFSLAFIENMGSCVATAPIHLKLNILGSIFAGTDMLIYD